MITYQDKPPMRRIIFALFSLVFVLVTLVLETAPAFAQLDTAWVRMYNGSADTFDRANAIDVDGLGNICVTGYSYGIGTSEE